MGLGFYLPGVPLDAREKLVGKAFFQLSIPYRVVTIHPE